MKKIIITLCLIGGVAVAEDIEEAKVTISGYTTVEAIKTFPEGDCGMGLNNYATQRKYQQEATKFCNGYPAESVDISGDFKCITNINVECK
jgi:hypothetical protein